MKHLATHTALAVAALVLALLHTPLPVATALPRAAQFTVTKITDTNDGVCNADCSLREAIAAANAAPGPDTISLGPLTYTLAITNTLSDNGEDDADEDANARGDLDITGDLTITGVSPISTTLDADFIDRFFEVRPGATVAISNLAIVNGQTPERGGAIANSGTLALSNLLLSNNAASSVLRDNDGGGIFNEGTLTISTSTLTSNDVVSGETGYGQGGGIYNTGTLTVSTSTISDNAAYDDNDAGGGGGIYNSGVMTISASAVISNTTGFNGGGGIQNSEAGRATVVNTTISDNDAPVGSGVLNGSQLISSTAVLTLTNATVANNASGEPSAGVTNLAPGSFAIQNTIIVSNTAGFPDPIAADCVGPITSRGGNVVGLAGPCVFTATGDLTGANPQLGPLARNGGPTLTQAIPRSSPAVNRGVAPCPATDQRGLPRHIGDARCDAGAYETQPAAIAVVSGSGQSAPETLAFAQPLVVRVTDGGGQPFPGVAVAFSAPASGPRASFSPAQATTDASGNASVSAQAIAGTGSYSVTATVVGLPLSAALSLTNTAGPAPTLAVAGGSGQSAAVGQLFAQPLTARVTNVNGQGVGGVTVRFNAPSGGPSAQLSAPTAITDPNGNAFVTAVAAGGVGSYDVIATIEGGSQQARFTLTNTPATGTTRLIYLPVVRKQ